MENYILLAFVEDKPGVLNKVAMLLRRKMYNISSLTVNHSEKKGISRMTITLSTDKSEKVPLAIRQLEKLPEVIRVLNMDLEKGFWREVALIRCVLKTSKITEMQKRYNLMILVDRQGEKIIQIVGQPTQIDQFIADISPKHVLEVARTGVTAMLEKL